MHKIQNQVILSNQFLSAHFHKQNEYVLPHIDFSPRLFFLPLLILETDFGSNLSIIEYLLRYFFSLNLLVYKIIFETISRPLLSSSKMLKCVKLKTQCFGFIFSSSNTETVFGDGRRHCQHDGDVGRRVRLDRFLQQTR